MTGRKLFGQLSDPLRSRDWSREDAAKSMLFPDADIGFHPGKQAQILVASSDQLALFDREDWSAGAAIWFMATGSAPPKSRRGPFGVLCRHIDGLGRQPVEGEAALPAQLNPWVRKLKIFQQGPAFRAPVDHHGWVRWAIQMNLPISFGFWSRYYQWKAARWHLGVEYSQQCVITEGPTGEPKLIDLGLAEMPSEATWHLPFLYEKQFFNSHKLPFFFGKIWRIDGELAIRLVAEHAAMLKRRTGDTPARALERKTAVGAPVYEALAEAVFKFATQLGLQQEESGRYYFAMSREDLINRLRDLDSRLLHIKDRTIKEALAGFVRSKRGPIPGRPRESKQNKKKP